MQYEETPNPLLPDGYALVWALLMLVYAGGTVAVWLLALVSIGRHRMESGTRIAWVLAVVFAPVLGGLAWFLAGRPRTPRAA